MILVTGATGLTGNFIIKELQRRNIPVRALVRESSLPAAQKLRVDIAVGDLMDPASLRRACDGVSAIVHTAVTPNDPKVDVAAMQTLLGRWQDGPFVYISSLDVYGLSSLPLITEDVSLDERNFSDYGRGKVTCERLMMETARFRKRTDFSILRASNIWGPHPIAKQRLKAHLDDEMTVLPGSNENQWAHYRDAWIDVRDMAWIVAESLIKPVGGPVNTLAGHFHWHDLYVKLIRVTGRKCRIVHMPLEDVPESARDRMRFYAQSWRYGNAKLKEKLDFRTQRTWQQTVAETIVLG